MLASFRSGNRLTERVAYGYPRAFRYTPDGITLSWITKELEQLYNGQPVILDPTAGGGTIPFEATRLGFDAVTSDLNSVAAFVRKITIEEPLRYCSAAWGQVLNVEFARCSGRLMIRDSQPKTANSTFKT